MAENTDIEADGEAAAGGKKSLILFVVVLVVAIGASVGGTIFFLGGSESATEEVVETKASTKQQAIYHNMRPPYIINYLTGTKPRYLQAEFTIMSRNEESIEALILHMPLIRSEIVSYLAEQNFVELQTQEGKEVIRKGIVTLINKILATYEVKTGVESALITNFVLQ